MNSFFSDLYVKCKKVITSIIPAYSILPLLLLVMMNVITYNGTRIFTTGMYHHSLKTFLDDYIPLNTGFIYIYVLAYFQWFIGYLLISRESRTYCFRYLFGEVIAKFLCLIIFVIYPTTILRPEITGNGLSDVLTRYIYRLDAPDNLFPSIHCLESYICFRGSLRLTKTPKWYPAISLVFSLLVFASTVCLKQHVVLDIFGAILAAEIGLGMSGIYFRKKGWEL